MDKSLDYFFTKEKILKEKGKKILGFTLISPTFPPPPLKEKILKNLPLSFSYSPSGGEFALREALANFYSQKEKALLKKENVFIGNGGKEIIYILLQVLLNGSGEVILVSPYWAPYPRMVKIAGGRTNVFKTSSKDNFYPDVEKLIKKISPKTKALILNTPSNPSGQVLREKDAKLLAEISLKKNFVLIADEVYYIYDYENHYCSFLKFFHKNIFCVFSASKILSLCGWRLGWGFGNQGLIETMVRYQANLSTSAHTLSQLIIRDLFRERKEVLNFLLKNKEEARKRRDLVVSLLRKRNINFIFPEGGLAILVKIPYSFRDAFSFAQTLLEKERVSVAPGEIFGEKKYFRMNLALSQEDIKEGIQKIAKYYVK